MKIGKNISEMQRNLLEAAKNTKSVPELFHIFNSLIADDDIMSEKEDIHPDWAEVFEAKKSIFKGIMPSRKFERFVSFFNEISFVDQSLLYINPEKLKITFLLGAGASKPSPSNIPTVKELLPQLLERARRLDRDDVTKLADFCERRKIDNIEDLLTAAQLATFCSRNPIVLQLMNYLLYRREAESQEEEWVFVNPWDKSKRIIKQASSADLSSVAFLQDTLQVLFGLLASTMLPAKPNKAHKSIAKYSNSSQHPSVVTTNYDCLMDLALGEVKQPFNYCIDFANRSKNNEIDKDSNAIDLIKLHGSLNWYYCETCQEVQLVDIKRMLEQYINDQAPYPVIGICKDCGGQKRGLLVPPLAMKFDVAPPLTPLLSKAIKSFEKSDIIVVVGFSFAEADLYISRMISKSMQTNAKQKIVIVDPDSSIINRLRRKFKASIPNFDEKRIIRLIGDCSELLPKFLSGQFYKEKENSVEAIENKEQ